MHDTHKAVHTYMQAISGAGAVLLQQEVPEEVNMHAAGVRLA